MKTLLLVAISLLVVSSAATGEITNTKLLLHATQSISDSSNWQTAGWVIVPNFTNPSKAVVVAGGRYQVKNWWVEANAGALVVEPEDGSGQRERHSLFEIRASYDSFDPVHFWTNVQYVPDNDYWYTYLDVNYRLPIIGLVGLETENNHLIGQRDDLSIGPRLVLPFKKGSMVLVGSYQWHNHGDNQVWLRTVVNF